MAPQLTADHTTAPRTITCPRSESGKLVAGELDPEPDKQGANAAVEPAAKTLR